MNKIVAISSDQPPSAEGTAYIVYRFTGAVSYLNYFDHAKMINTLV